jgi:hypothetical protein
MRTLWQGDDCIRLDVRESLSGFMGRRIAVGKSFGQALARAAAARTRLRMPLPLQRVCSSVPGLTPVKIILPNMANGEWAPVETST